MSASADIKTYLRTGDWAIWLLCLPIFGGMAALIPLLVLSWWYFDKSWGQPPLGASLSIWGLGIFLAAWFGYWIFDRQFWCLTETDLIGGIRRKIRLPLSSIEKITVGLPNKFQIPGMEKFIPPQIRSTSILLRFSDGSWLPMRLHETPNGSRLIDELLTRFSERVDENYEYSKDEIKILRKADINVLIKRKNDR